MWDNALATYDGETVRIDGLERAFVGESTKLWGTERHPCPVVGLVPGTGCEAVSFRIPFGARGRLLRMLKQREGGEGGRLRAVRVRDGDGRPQRAKMFVTPEASRPWDDRQAVITALREAKGVVGTGAEYIRTLIHAMELWQVDDSLVRDIWEEIRS